jgi:serine/threonine protein kinase
MKNQRSARNQGFLKDFSLSEQYLIRPNLSSGKPGLIEGAADGVNVLVKVWPRKPKQADDDLAEIWRHELRQLHRLAGFPGASDLIASLLHTGQDANGFYLVLDTGQRSPLETILTRSNPSHWLKAPRNQVNRLRLWANIARIVRALEILHSQGLIHRNIDSWSILTTGLDEADFQLTGFEWSMRLSGLSQPARERESKHTSPAKFDSFRSDWKDLGSLAAGLLAVRLDRLSDLSISASEVADHADITEIRLLRKLLGVEPKDGLDGDFVIDSISEITRRLEAGVAQNDAQYRLVVRLGQQSRLTQEIRKTAGYSIDVDDTDAQIAFIRDDISERALIVGVKNRDQPNEFRVLLRGHQLQYQLQPYRPFNQQPTWDMAYCEAIEPLPPLAKHLVGDPAVMAPESILIMTTAQAADDFSRIRKRISSWEVVRRRFRQEREDPSNEKRLLKAFALSQLVEMSFAVSDIFPVRVAAMPDEVKDDDGQYRVRVEIRPDSEREQLAKALKIKPLSDRFEQMLSADNSGEEGGWTLTDSPSLGDRALSETEWRYVGRESADVGTAFIFAGAEPVPSGSEAYMVPIGSVGTIVQFKRRIKALGALEEHLELLHMLTDQRGRVQDSQDVLDETDDHFASIDTAKQAALKELTAVLPLYLVQGPPGVGKTHLVRELVRRRFADDPTARLLLTAQSHAAIDHLMAELSVLLEKDQKARDKPLIVRCRKKDKLGFTDHHDIQNQASALLRGLVESELIADGTREVQSRLKDLAADDQVAGRGGLQRRINNRPQSGRAAFESVVLRAANVVFATTNAPELERLIEERGQFDWSIVEEAGKATGGELIAPLLLSHRRLMIGDHKQLPPYRSDDMRKLLGSEESMSEVVRVAPGLISRSLRGSAIDDLLEDWQDADVSEVGGDAIDSLLMFQSMIEREFQHQKQRPAARKIARSLNVQHRMHPDISALVSGVFYRGDLTTHPDRETRSLSDPPPFSTVQGSKLPNTPITVVTMPDVQSMVGMKQGDELPPWSNEGEVAVVIEVLGSIRPTPLRGANTSLAVLSPYARQVRRLHREIESARSTRLHHLSSFSTAGDGQSFCSTVDAFQGNEADIVVISLVRNNQHTKPALALGFLRDFRRMNVLLSRAKSRMIIVASLDFLRSVVQAQAADSDRDYKFLRDFIDRLDTGIADGRIGSISSADLLRARFR